MPDDLALDTCDETTWASLVQPTDEIVKTATAMLRQRVADPDRPPRQVILKGQLLVRGFSTPRR